MTGKTEGITYLKQVTEKLKLRLEELNRLIAEGQKDIEGMHEYYWENYAEMDQYGYEEFDNQQALLHQVNANQENLKMKHRLERMLDAPFFGRVDFLYEGEEEAESFYIGIGNFAEKAGMVPMIYDWRAPVSGLFYDYDKGPASYQAPAGQMDGEILSKWQYKIRGGKMIYEFESDVKIDDEILKQELGGNGDVQLKNIVRTIQREQNAIIRNTGDRILVIQGAAGSGKTSIALHRIAYLLYHDRESLRSSNVLVLSPNSVFSDYISHILPELGEENIQEMSFDLFAYRELRDTAADCEDRYDWLERQMETADEEEKSRYRWKQSEAFVGETEGFLAQLEDRLVDFHPVKFRGMEMSDQELIQMFYFKFQDAPLLARMDRIMEYFVDAWETLHGRDLSEEERASVQTQFDSMYVTKDVYEIYQWLMEDCGCPALPAVPWEKRMLRYEDVFPMLYLKYRLQGKNAHTNIKHLVIDEMQDYSYLQYEILKTLFSCRMTILGDRAQTLDEEVQDVLSFLPGILGKDLKKIILNKSYRNTVEIAEYAQKLADLPPLELFERHGKPVEEAGFPSLEAAVKAAVGNLRLCTIHNQASDETADKASEDREEEHRFETAAVLTRTEREAKSVYEILQKLQIPASLMDKNSSSFPRGLTVTTYYLAKGLEFDQVFAVTEDADSPLLRQVRYLCATRALHELYMYRVGSDGSEQ